MSTGRGKRHKGKTKEGSGDRNGQEVEWGWRQAVCGRGLMDNHTKHPRASYWPLRPLAVPSCTISWSLSLCVCKCVLMGVYVQEHEGWRSSLVFVFLNPSLLCILRQSLTKPEAR